MIQDDCLDALTAWAGRPVDLAYLDPPFNTGRTHRGPGTDAASYADSWPSIDAYLGFLRPRVEAVHRVLGADGSILVHCDWRTCHHVRMLLDHVFGADGFVNHLVWVYGLGGSSPRRFARKHDDILFYAKGPEYYFSAPLVPSTSNRMKGRLKKATDVIDIPAINNMAAERVGYPTQKPMALLTLLVEACCPPGGIVLDPFCGSGTTLVAAGETGRSYVGIDVSAEAVAVARARLAKAPPSPALFPEPCREHPAR